MQADFRAFEQAVANLKSSAPQAFMTVALTPGLSRSSSDVQKVALSPKAQLIELSLPLLADQFDSYRAVLLNNAGKELWNRDGLRPSGENKSIVVILPIDALSPGDYTVRLSGHSGSNPPENIATYPFHAER
jgi:hypothetical protein